MLYEAQKLAKKMGLRDMCSNSIPICLVGIEGMSLDNSKLSLSLAQLSPRMLFFG